MQQQAGIKILAYQNASQEFINQSKNKLINLFVHDLWDFSSEKPDILFFASGGSESEALKYVEGGQFVILIAFSEDNAYAAASEVKAYCDQILCDSVLLSLDDPGSVLFINHYLEIISGLASLKNKKVGLIGHVSDWLIASDVSRELIKEKFGVEVIEIPWDKVEDYKHLESSKSFSEKYISEELDVIGAGKIQQTLRKTIENFGLDAITVECFSLVKENHVTACLALSDLNDTGIAAGCEGDLTSIIGMMIMEQLTGTIPWMANLAKISGNRVILAHCTAPTGLLDSFEIDTHFETGEGTAVKGHFSTDQITIIRFNHTFDKVFFASGEIIARPSLPGFCRTQIEVKMQKQDIEALKSRPLGNHHLVAPGNQTEILNLFTRITGIKSIVTL